MAAICWKRRKSYQRNVLTLSQTMALFIFLFFNGVITDYLLLPSDKNSVFVIEMLRVIILENLVFKFAFPLYLIVSTQSSLPSLWTRKRDTQIEFFMTKTNFRPEPSSSSNTGPVHTSFGAEGRLNGSTEIEIEMLPPVQIV